MVIANWIEVLSVASIPNVTGYLLPGGNTRTEIQDKGRVVGNFGRKGERSGWQGGGFKSRYGGVGEVAKGINECRQAVYRVVLTQIVYNK